ncbi:MULTISPECIES: hypothetical protein [unclassified Pseudomonas]|uniref:hypothetical protein n=1 Tax=unclassified Pseudomonas TaxID=196821 RepID=UPI002446B1E6|nr:MULTISPECIES: hypothetical protein [unclassified Pseudomonas]MDH0302802.1 hypothetical protein [Pseudomonas sp. GD04091]MDH1984385.1 hypothetical protein [Pseudomonas sp. GD03689]
MSTQSANPPTKKQRSQATASKASAISKPLLFKIKSQLVLPAPEVLEAQPG